MPGTLHFDSSGLIARITLANPGKLNAIDIAMWRELRLRFEQLQALPAAEAPHAIVVCGADGQFASGGDIWEGSVELPSEVDQRPSVEASRFGPVALLETANTTPNSTGAHELAVAGQTIYAHMRRMGGSVGAR